MQQQQKTCWKVQQKKQRKAKVEIKTQLSLWNLSGEYTQCKYSISHSAKEAFDWSKNFQVKDVFCRERSPKVLRAKAKTDLQSSHWVDEMPNFSLGHDDPLWEVCFYPESNYSTFCYMVHAFKLQLSSNLLDIEFGNIR